MRSLFSRPFISFYPYILSLEALRNMCPFPQLKLVSVVILIMTLRF